MYWNFTQLNRHDRILVQIGEKWGTVDIKTSPVLFIWALLWGSHKIAYKILGRIEVGLHVVMNHILYKFLEKMK
jgi:hypothetical protein